MTSIVTFNILESPAVFLARVNQAGMVIKHFLNNDHSFKKKYALRNFSATMDILSKIHFSRSSYNI